MTVQTKPETQMFSKAFVCYSRFNILKSFMFYKLSSQVSVPLQDLCTYDIALWFSVAICWCYFTCYSHAVHLYRTLVNMNKHNSSGPGCEIRNKRFLTQLLDFNKTFLISLVLFIKSASLLWCQLKHGVCVICVCIFEVGLVIVCCWECAVCWYRWGVVCGLCVCVYVCECQIAW